MPNNSIIQKNFWVKYIGRGRSGLIRVVTGVILINIIWRIIRYLLVFPLWGDEAFVAVNFQIRDFAGLLQPLEYGQIAPLGFLWVELAVVKLAGISELALRFFPLVTGLITIILFRPFALALVKDIRTSLVATAWFAASYYPVRHGVELKPYVTDLFLALVLTWLGWLVYSYPESRTKWLALLFTALIAPWFSLPIIFTGGAIGLLFTYKIYKRYESKSVLRLIIFSIIFLSSYGVMYIVFARPHAQAAPYMQTYWSEAFPPLMELWKLPMWLINIHTGNMLAYPVGGKNGGSTLTFILVVVGLYSLWKKQRCDLLILLLGPLLFTFIAASIHKYPYGVSARISLFMAPAFCILAGVGVVEIIKYWQPKRKAPSAIMTVCIVLGCIAIVGIVKNIIHPYKMDADPATRQVILNLVERTKAGDQWIIYNALDDNLDYAPDMRPWGGESARIRYYITRLANCPISWAPDPGKLSQKSESGRIFLLVYKFSEHEFSEEQFTAYLDNLKHHSGFAEPEFESHALSDYETLDIYSF